MHYNIHCDSQKKPMQSFLYLSQKLITVIVHTVFPYKSDSERILKIFSTGR